LMLCGAPLSCFTRAAELLMANRRCHVLPQLLQRDIYAVGSQTEFQIHIRGQELDDHTVFNLKIQRCAPTRDGNPDARVVVPLESESWVSL
jgi:hypothetical protein